jgi:glycosyltransferase involved in cell wall biosynthesis
MNHRPIHVAHLTTLSDANAPSQLELVEQYRALTESDVLPLLQTSLVVLNRRRAALPDRIARAAQQGQIGVEVVPWRWWCDPTLPWRLAWRLRQAEVNLVHAHDTTAWLLALLLQPWLGFRMVATADLTGRRPETASRVLWRSLLTGFDRVIAANHRLAMQLCRIGCRTSQVEVIPNGVDTQRFSRGAVESDFRLHWGLDRRARIVGVPGGVLDDDDLRLALAAVRAVQTRLGPLHVIVFGDTAVEPRWARIAEQCGVRPRTHMVAGSDHLPEIYAALDLLLVPAACDGEVDRVMLEAQSMELPLVCSRREGIEDLVEPGRTALVVDQREPQPLADAVIQLLTNAGHGRALAEAARLRICQRYDLQEHLRHVMHTYEHVMAQS